MHISVLVFIFLMRGNLFSKKNVPVKTSTLRMMKCLIYFYFFINEHSKYNQSLQVRKQTNILDSQQIKTPPTILSTSMNINNEKKPVLGFKVLNISFDFQLDVVLKRKLKRKIFKCRCNFLIKN